MSSARELNKRNTAPFKQTDFGGGMVRHAPHEEIPESSIADGINCHCHPREIRPRGASYLFSDKQPPVLWGRNCGDPREGYVLSKNKDIVTSESGDIFFAYDVGNYIVWPGDPPHHDEIYEYISATEVRVGDSEDKVATGGCWIHGRLNANDFHRAQRKKIWQWGNEVYIAPNTSPMSRQRSLCVSRQKPSNTLSCFDEMDDYGLLGNSKGIYKLRFDRDPPIHWKINTPCPSVLIEDVFRNQTYKIRHDYIYSMARLTGTGIRGANTNGVVIEQESGTCELDTSKSPARDYGIRWHESKIDVGVRTQGRLVGGVLAAAQQSPNYWAVTIPAPGASFGIELNERTENFLIDFGPGGYNVTNLHEVASALQIEVRMVFPTFTAEYLEGGYFVFTSGEEDKSTIGYVVAGVGGTDISALMMMTAATADKLDNTYAWAKPYVVGKFSVPVVDDEPDTREQLWTHYRVYRTGDIGPNGVTPRVNEKNGEDLPPLTFTWDKDLRIAAAFYAHKTKDGIVHAHIGEFELADVGATIEWEDLEINTIIEFIDSSHVRVSEGEYYYEEAKPLQAVALGGGRPIRASETDGIVTIESVYNKLRFSCDDVGKTITWSTGYYSIITAYISPTQVEVDDDLDKETQGLTLDPTERYFSDIDTDENLRNRQGERHIGLLNHRFWLPLPNANIIRAVPGFLLTAQRTDTKVPYCQLETNKKYLAGNHLELEQTMDNIQHPIQWMLKAPNYFVVLCNVSAWAGPTNNPKIAKLPEFGEEYAVLHADVIDEAIGCVDWASVQEVSYGVFEMLCTDGSWRQLVNLRYSQDYTVNEVGQDIIGRDLKKNWNLGESCYTKKLGHIWWGTLR